MKVLITGATSDLGISLAQVLAKESNQMILTAKSADKLRALPIKAKIIECDLTKREELLKAIESDPPDLLINNAGLGFYGEALDHTIEEQMQIAEVNAMAVAEITLTAAKAGTSTILNIASVAGFFPFPTFSLYSASKAFVINLSLSLDSELKKRGIRVLCACPGQIRTGFRQKAAKGKPQKHSILSMSVEKATDEIIKQIKKKKTLHIFDWRYRVGVLLMKLIPVALRNRILVENLRDRL